MENNVVRSENQTSTLIDQNSIEIIRKNFDSKRKLSKKHEIEL